MALNWAMIEADGSKPVPLPEEKIWLSIENCQMSLEFKEQSRKYEGKGAMFVTNQRVVFLQRPASATLRSINIPLANHLVDCRYMIPIIAAPYYEAGVIPVPGGDLVAADQESHDRPPKGLLKVWFLEGGGAAFRDAVEEVRNLARGGQHGEQLPAYHPRTTGSRAPSIAPTAATVDSSLSGRTLGQQTTSQSAAGGSRLSSAPVSRSVSQLAPEDLEAARVALQQEEVEREAIRQRAERDDSAPGVTSVSSGAMSGGSTGAATSSASTSTAAQPAHEAPAPAPAPASGEAPPSYTMVSPVTTFVPSQHDNEQVRRRRGSMSSAQSRSVVGSSGSTVASTLQQLLACPEGRDRMLQTIQGLLLLFHHTFGSVRQRHLRSYGVWPVPHLLFFLFPREIRRKTLRRLEVGSEAAASARRLLLLMSWVLSVRLASSRSDKQSDDNKGRRAGDLQDASYQANQMKGGKHQASEETEIPTSAWQEHLEKATEWVAKCGEASDLAAFLGGSSVVWRVLRGGGSGVALRGRQRRGLERFALALEIIALSSQLYLMSSTRRRLRKQLGRIHRRTLLLTDRLADAQDAEAGSIHARATSPSLDAAYASLTASEQDFQSTRRALRQSALEARIHTFELGFALYDTLAPSAWERQGWESWTSIVAGLLGMRVVCRESQ